ncbi:thiamine pyrophosphate-binding protein [Dactylosporangium sucinum]|uniref:Acetolactate synthase I/II/III large subunit n=1 Tax=Dactylosporangium sucinum TaxID=1424081 RepID=A0A917WIN8_9ACTN|nr:thiamine pyrophosphate-binding protein [Dactylosporangium sucinum]GGM06699.1 acetolactate synthase I/II/III large subunit [Dactylosporangium sucinum]
MNVAEAVARVLVACGADHAFGLIGSGNFHLANAFVAAGGRFVPAVHEGGAASMADGWARTTGRTAVLTVHQGPGVTNAFTGLAEAAKSRTPLVVLAPEATNPRSNFHVDLPGLAAAVGAGFVRVRAEHAAADVLGAFRQERTVVVALPLDVQAAEAPGGASVPPAPPFPPAAVDVAPLAGALRAARRPVFIAGRGATRSHGAREALVALADRCGALLATSAAAKGLFAGEPWSLDVSGGFATPLAAELIGGADLVVAFGSTLNMWTTRHGRLIGDGAVVAQVDTDPAALGVHRPVDVALAGDVATVARDCLAVTDETPGWRGPALRERIAAEGAWRSVAYTDDGDPGRIDPRTLSIALDDLLPAQRTVVIDSGNFMGYPSMFLSVPDRAGFLFTQAFQSVGLGLASALGAAVARPDRLTVAALGDGGFLMSAAELATAATLGAPLLVVVYDDAAYGAEVHHFGPDGHPLDLVRLPDRDLAAIARGYGCSGVTVRTRADLDPVAAWLAGDRSRPLVVDAKVTSERGAWWLEEAFRGH